MIWKHGRRLRGPELVTTAEFNEKLGRSKRLTMSPAGWGGVHQRRADWWDKLLHKNLSRWARVPREREAMHFLIVGDSGTGKIAAIRQILAQIWERGEAAIVYDPAMEYLPQFYNEARGDVMLNPLGRAVSVLDSGRRGSARSRGSYLSRYLVPGSGPGEPVLRRSAEENLRSSRQSEADAGGADVAG